MLAGLLPLCMIGVVRSGRRLPAILIMTIAMALTLSAHKEFRFVLPAMPLCFIYAGWALADLQARRQTGKRFGKLYIESIVFLAISNIALIGYFGLWHQRAPVQIMEYLSERIENQSSDAPEPWRIDFLTWCHATPLYSHVHRRISLRILECEPRFEGTQCVGDRYHSESEVIVCNCLSGLACAESLVIR